MSLQWRDPYVIPGTRCLRNLLGHTDPAVLAEHELRIVAAQAVLAVEHVRRTTEFSMETWRTAHRVLFSPVYDWAGEIRTTDLAKGDDQFCPAGMIEAVAGRRFKELAGDNFLRGLDEDTFVRRAAHHYIRLNEIHPFREGNGRSQRIVMGVMAWQAGYDLAWSGVTKAELHQAAAESYAARSAGPFEPLIRRIARRLGPSAAEATIEEPSR